MSFSRNSTFLMNQCIFTLQFSETNVIHCAFNFLGMVIWDEFYISRFFSFTCIRACMGIKLAILKLLSFPRVLSTY